MWLEKLILKKAEKRLRPYRIQAESVKQERAAQYQQYVPQITTLYARATHWHGTGRYHYRHQEDSRYQGLGDDSVDILTEIIESGGLKPHQDPWIYSGGKTVSLATVRMHARGFARIHADEESIFVYELGSVTYWFRLYVLLLLVWLFTNMRSQRVFIKGLFRPSFFQDIQSWTRAIRKPDDKNLPSMSDIFGGYITASDIAGNYPVLIGVVANPENLVDTIPLTHKVEQRSLHKIILAQFTHIEVPLQYVATTEEILKEKSIFLPVIPLEFGDLYLANEPLDKLAFS